MSGEGEKGNWTDKVSNFGIIVFIAVGLIGATIAVRRSSVEKDAVEANMRILQAAEQEAAERRQEETIAAEKRAAIDNAVRSGQCVRYTFNMGPGDTSYIIGPNGKEVHCCPEGMRPFVRKKRIMFKRNDKLECR